MTSPISATSTIVLLGIPPRSFVGIDLVSFNSSPNFHGIAKIPVGFHCLYTGTDASLSIRHCQWLKFDPSPSHPRTYVLRWSHEVESLILLSGSEDEARAALRSIPSLRGRGLVDYVALQDANSSLKAKQSGTSAELTDAGGGSWPSLSHYITVSTLDRILNPSQPGGQAWTVSSISSAPIDTESIPGLSTEEAAEVLNDNQASTIHLTTINLKQTWPDESIGRDRTEKARDRSWYLGYLVDSLVSATGDEGWDKGRQAGAMELLAELQFCFLMVLTLANYSCLEQWKRILSVVFTCKATLSNVEGFFIEVVKVLRTQLERVEDVEGGLFEMNEEAGSAWLRGLLKTFRGNVDEAFGMKGEEKGLSAELTKLETWLRDTYGWEDETSLLRRGMVDLEDGERIELQMDGLDEDEETGEYAPVVVEM